MTRKHFVYKIYSEKTIERTERKMRLLGTQGKKDIFLYLNIRFILSALLFVLLFIFAKYSYFVAPILTILFYILCEYIVLDLPIKKRIIKLEDEAIFFFEVLILTLDSTQNIKAALELTCRNIDNEVSEEFKKTLSEAKLGKSFTESLISMKERIPSETINTILLSLTESSIYGNNIIDTLNNQLDYLREKKQLEIKAQINKLPTKISVISVLFFIPIMLLVILAPLLVDFLLG